MPAKPRTLKGRVSQRREGIEIGRENFSMSIWDKGRIVRSAIEFDDYKVLRDCNYSVDADWNPQEAFFREIIDGELIAHAWWKVVGTKMDCEAWTKQMGRVSQMFELGHPIQTFSLHTLLTDVMATMARKTSDPGVEKPIHGVNNASGAPYGMANYHAMPHAPFATYVGPTTVTVPAGAFEANHFKIRWGAAMKESCDYWVMKDHYLPLRLKGSYEAVTYELEEFSES
jgi:hypothetical protein